MKQLKLLFTVLFLAVLGLGNVWGAEVTFTNTSESWGTSQGAQSVTKSGVTIAASNGLGSGTQYRIYKYQTLTVSIASGSITEVKITCTANGTAQYGPGCFSDETSGSYSYSEKVGTWSGNASSFSLTASSNQVRATEIKVTYTTGGGTPEPEPLTVLTTMDEIFAAATTAGSTAADTKITFNNWVISGVKGRNAYLTDNNGKGLIIYQNAHGFEVGDILSGTTTCKVQLFNGSAELTALTSTTEGLTVTEGGVVTPITTATIASLGGVNTGAVYSFTELTYNGSVFSDGTNTITPYGTFITLPAMTKDQKYDVKGVFIQYNTTKEIAPLATDDIKEFVPAGKTLTALAIGGTATKTTYTEGETFDPAGLTVTATYSEGDPETLTSGFNWEVTPAGALAVGTTSVSVKATKGTVESAAKEVSITVNAIPALTTIPAIFNAATGTDVDTKVTFNNWVVSGVTNSNVYVTDNEGHGLILYKSSHGFAAGDIINGTVTCPLVLFRGSAELKNLTSATEGLTVTKGGVVTPITTASIADLGGVNTGAIYSFSELTYNGSVFSDGENTLKPYNTFINLPALTIGQKYDVKGVFIQYNTTKEIAPLAAEDIKEIVATKYDITIAEGIVNGTVNASADQAVAGAEVSLTATPADGYELGTWIVKGADQTPITVTDNKFTMPAQAVTVSATFVVRTSFTSPILGYETFGLTMGGGSTFAQPNVNENSITFDGITLTTVKNDGYTVRFDETYTRLYQKNDLVITAPAGKAIAKIVLNRVPNGDWNNGATVDPACETYDDAATAPTWTGEAKKVTFTFGGTHRLASVTVKLVDYVAQAYAITAAECSNGEVAANVTEAIEGTEITLTATPYEGYEFEAWNVYKTGDEATKVTVTDNKFTMPAYEVTIAATFKLIPVKYAITVATCENGEVAADVTGAEAAENDVITLTATPAEGYMLEAWNVYKTGDEATKVTVTDNKFTMPAYNVTIAATFKLIPPSYLVYKTGFESDEDFTATTTYNTEVEQGPDGAQWKTLGTVTTNDKNDGDQGLQMRVYSGQTKTPYAMPNFTLNKVSKVEFYGRSEDLMVCKAVVVKYSLNGGSTWATAETLTMTTSWAAYSVAIPEQSATMRIRFEVDYTAGSKTKKITIDDVKIYSTVKPAPSINAANVEIEYSATAGEIAYTIDNPVEETELTAASEAAWISNIAVEATKVTFTATANTEYTARTATVTLTYGTVTKDVTISQKAAPKPKFAINVAEDIVNGTVAANPAEAEEDAVVELVITPAAGYTLNELVVKGADETVITVTDNKFTMPAQAVNIAATFKVKPEVVIDEFPYEALFAPTEYEDGWMSNAAGTTTNNCVLIGYGENLTSPKLDLRGIGVIEIALQGRRYGTLENSEAIVSVAIDGGETLGTTKFKGTGPTNNATDVIIYELPANTDYAKLVFTCTNATEATQKNGAGIHKVTIKAYVPEPVRANLTVGKMGTICYGYDLKAIEGATFYEPEYFDGMCVGFKEATEVKAGYGYLYVAEAAELKAVKLGEEVTAAVADAQNHMQGTLSDITLPVGNDYCGVKNNHLQYFGANNTMTAGHAYIVLTDLPASQPTNVAARRLRVGPAGVSTGLEFNDAEAEAQKLLIDGAIYIVRGGHVYNAAGLLVK